MINELDITQFRTVVWEYYYQKGRHDLPWRQAEADGSFDPYKILVSEVMLQQTQVQRVIPKYHEFITAFPDVYQLANAPLGEVLKVWNGLGYNRRAKFLHLTAQKIVRDHNGIVPSDLEQLMTLPGIGSNTAGAIVVYAFNAQVPFIETNIRTVYIHHFFDEQPLVSDQAILPITLQTMDQKQPRLWYWALMDYGAFLKSTTANLHRRSRQYIKQSKFEGSKRQLRGQVLRLLSERAYSLTSLQTKINDVRLPTVLSELVSENLIRHRGTTYSL